MSHPQSPTYRVGYALEPKKVRTFILQTLITHARARGIDLVQIETTTPLTSQGRFDCIIHKLYGDDWKKQLEEFSTANPSAVIIDPPELIEKLHNRITMLEVVNLIDNLAIQGVTVGIPKQWIMQEVIEGLDLIFPLIAKPLEADGGPNSHNLCLVFDKIGVKSLSFPVVLQEFVNHGGVIFKIYVAGRHVSCVKRKSLSDIPEEKQRTMSGILPFSRVSNLAVESDGQNDDAVEKNIEEVEMPPEGLIQGLAKSLKEALGLNLFNFDLIRDVRDKGRYLVIDVNYFPGYAKLPTYESFFTDFLWDVVHKETA